VKDQLAVGQLRAAVETAPAEVRSRPNDSGARYILSQLLCIEGELERADKQLDIIAQQEANLAPAVVQLRQVIRAEQARQQFLTEGRLPEFLRPPSDHVKLCLEAAVSLRRGSVEKAAELAARAEDLRPHPTGTCNGRPFDDFRDLDDLTAGYLEVLTTTGKFYVVAIDEISRMEFHRPENPGDLIWRRIQMAVHDGPDGEVFIPAIYATRNTMDDGARLGRTTEWIGSEGEPIQGVGQRSFLVGEEDIPIMELADIEFNIASK
ncbi:MAG: type VI secretion system accessory protein TagJ, partial [Stellaceae bacterium]